jgi:hypothetical protein
MAKRDELTETLDEREVIRILEVLRNRIAERFPTRNLTKTAMQLLDIARVTASEAEGLRYPNWPLRILWIIVTAIGFWGLGMLIKSQYVIFISTEKELTEFAQGLEATFNIVAICSIVIFFCFRYEASLKRRAALTGLYRLRTSLPRIRKRSSARRAPPHRRCAIWTRCSSCAISITAPRCCR